MISWSTRERVIWRLCSHAYVTSFAQQWMISRRRWTGYWPEWMAKWGARKWNDCQTYRFLAWQPVERLLRGMVSCNGTSACVKVRGDVIVCMHICKCEEETTWGWVPRYTGEKLVHNCTQFSRDHVASILLFGLWIHSKWGPAWIDPQLKRVSRLKPRGAPIC